MLPFSFVTMIEIQAIGGYYPTDVQGYLQNIANQTIQETYQPLVKDVIEVYQTYFPNLYSIYLRGSVARGTAQKNISDLDVFAIVPQQKERKYIYWARVAWSREVVPQLLKKYPFVTELDLAYSNYVFGVTPSNTAFNLLLKVQSKCIYGIDYAQQIPPFKLTSDLCINKKWYKQDLQGFLKIKSDTKKAQKQIQAILKISLRVCFELVFEREQKYTNSLYYCAQSFKTYYPEKSFAVNQCLHWYLNPPKNIEQVQNFLKDFGNWLLVELQEA